VVGDRQAVHTHLFRPGDKLRNAAHPVKETVLGMNVKMAKHRSSRRGFAWDNYTTAAGFPGGIIRRFFYPVTGNYLAPAPHFYIFQFIAGGKYL
jgi:hypothetical protein